MTPDEVTGKVNGLVQAWSLVGFLYGYGREPLPGQDDRKLADIRAALVAFTRQFSADYLALKRSSDPVHFLGVLDVALRYLVGPAPKVPRPRPGRESYQHAYYLGHRGAKMVRHD